MKTLSPVKLIILICATAFTVASGQPSPTTIATQPEVVFMARADARADYEARRDSVKMSDEKKLVVMSGIVPEWREKQIASWSQAHKNLYRTAYLRETWAVQLYLPIRKLVLWTVEYLRLSV